VYYTLCTVYYTLCIPGFRLDTTQQGLHVHRWPPGSHRETLGWLHSTDHSFCPNNCRAPFMDRLPTSRPASQPPLYLFHAIWMSILKVTSKFASSFFRYTSHECIVDNEDLAYRGKQKLNNSDKKTTFAPVG
jgi:hypothetical protein